MSKIIGMTIFAGLLTSGAQADDYPSRFATTAPPNVTVNARRTLSVWLANNPTYRVMTDSDCACGDDLTEIRTVTYGSWRAQPNYHPFYSVGDFDGDGLPDTAFAVTGAAGSFRVLIFHTPQARDPYLSPPFKRGQMLFFGAPRPRPWRLIVGPYGTDANAYLAPTAKHKYAVRYDECC